jgi:glycosyltransferase involved in cell wall biosynthesis
MRLAVFPNDPLYLYYDKGEIKKRYWNPDNIFSEIHLLSWNEWDIEPGKIKSVAGDAQLFIYALGKRNIFNFPFILYRALKIIKEIKPDIIRGHNPTHSGALTVYCAKRMNIPSIISLHTRYDEQRKKEKRFILYLYKLLEYYSFKNVSVVISVTEYVREYAEKMGAKNNYVIFNKVHLNQFETKTDYSLKKEPVILSVGRLDYPKDQECIIRAIRNLDVILILIGKGENHNSLKRLSEKFGIKNKIEFIESIFHDKISEYYYNADIFVMATHYEGFCIPILEAMSSGLPIIASNVGPIPEILGDTGFLVENTPEAFYEKIKTLLYNENLREHFGTLARERAKLFSGDLMEKKEANLYLNLLNGTNNSI